MKQGTANSQAGDQKREPISHAVDICSVADMGTLPGSSQQLYDGRGFQAPKNSSSNSNSGSQGKY